MLKLAMLKRASWLAALALSAGLVLPVAGVGAQTIPDWASGRTRAEAAVLEGRIGQLTRRLGVSQRMLQEIVRILGADPRRFTFQRITELLEQRAADAAQLRAKLDELAARLAAIEDAALRDPATLALNRARAALEQGRLAEAEQALAGLEVLRNATSAGATQAWVQAVEARADVAALQGRGGDAADIQLAAEAQLAAQTEATRWRLVMGAAAHLSREGDLTGDAASLERAVQILRRQALPLAPRETRPQDWASTQNSIGANLQILADRDPGTARLREAASAYQAALEFRVRGTADFLWAETQYNLGHVLMILYEREGGDAKLVDAVAAYRASLEVRTRQAHRLFWAASQTALANAYYRLGLARNDRQLLENARTAHLASLSALTNDDSAEWVDATLNYASFLGAMAARDQDRPAAREAVTRLETLTNSNLRTIAPVDWAVAMQSLGDAYAALSDIEGDPNGLLAAERAFRAALEVRRRDRMAQQWSRSQYALADILLRIGRAETGTARLVEAVAAFDLALEVITARHNFPDWASASSDRNLARVLIAQRSRDRALLGRVERDIRALRAAFREAGHASGIQIQDNLLAYIADVRRDM